MERNEEREREKDQYHIFLSSHSRETDWSRTERIQWMLSLIQEVLCPEGRSVGTRSSSPINMFLPILPKLTDDHQDFLTISLST